MRRHAPLWAAVVLFLIPQASVQKPFTLEQVLSPPFPSDLTAAKKSNRIAWILDQEGRRNIWAAEGTEFAARHITKYSQEDGQELSVLSFSPDGNPVVY